MKTVRTHSITIIPLIGFGFWKDDYSIVAPELSGYQWNIIIPFFRITFGKLFLSSQSGKEGEG